jgi:prevent-host-death family protein
MIRPSNIYSISTFTRNAKKLIQQVKATQDPIALTVNGQAEVVIVDAQEYERLVSSLTNHKPDLELDSLRGQYQGGQFVSLENLEQQLDENFGV